MHILNLDCMDETMEIWVKMKNCFGMKENNATCFNTNYASTRVKIIILLRIIVRWMYFRFDVAWFTIYEACKFRTSESTATCMFDVLIAMIYLCNLHIDYYIDMYTLYMDIQVIDYVYYVYSNLESKLAIIITIFIRLSLMFSQLNESNGNCIVNDNCSNCNESYYKFIIYGFSLVFICLTELLLWIKAFTWMIYQAIEYKKKDLDIISKKFISSANESSIVIDAAANKMIKSFRYCVSFHYISTLIIGFVHSIYLTYQLIYYSDVNKNVLYLSNLPAMFALHIIIISSKQSTSLTDATIESCKYHTSIIITCHLMIIIYSIYSGYQLIYYLNFLKIMILGKCLAILCIYVKVELILIHYYAKYYSVLTIVLCVNGNSISHRL